jgi:hypothetical protein
MWNSKPKTHTIMALIKKIVGSMTSMESSLFALDDVGWRSSVNRFEDGMTNYDITILF